MPPEISELLTAIAVAYGNRAMIGHEVAPQTPVIGRTYKYRVTDVNDAWKLPKTQIGPTGRVNQVEFRSSLADGSVGDNGLGSTMSAEELANYAKMGIDGVENRVQRLTELIVLCKEIEIATMAQDPANYAPANITSYTSLNDWTHPSTDIIAEIQRAQDEGVVEYNRIAMSSLLWNYVKKNPFVVKFVRGTTASENVSLREFADALELELVLKGGGRYDVALPGEPANLKRAWGNSPFLFRFERPSTSEEANTFMIDANWAMTGTSRIVSVEDQAAGIYGLGVSKRVVVGEYSKPLVTSRHYGHLFKNAAPTN